MCKKQGRYLLGLGSFYHCLLAGIMEFLRRTKKVSENSPEKVKFLLSGKGLIEETNKVEVSFKSRRTMPVESLKYFRKF